MSCIEVAQPFELDGVIAFVAGGGYFMAAVADPLACFAKKSSIGANAGAATLTWLPPGTSTYTISVPAALPASTMRRELDTFTVRSSSPWVTYCGMWRILAIPLGSPPPEIGPRAAHRSG